MAAVSRKSIDNKDLKKMLPVMECIDGVKQVEDQMHALERVSLDGVASIASSCQNAVQQAGALCAQTISSCTEASGQSLAIACQLGQGVIENQHNAAKQLMRIARETVECRSVDDFYNLQCKGAYALMGLWLGEVSEMTCGMVRAPATPYPLSLD